MLGAMLRVLIVALVLLVGIQLATTNLRRPPPAPELASYLETPMALPAFELLDASGASLTREALRGRFTLLFFGFTNCPDICPLTLAALAGAYAELEADRAPVQVVFVSVDPNRDTPERIAAYLESFDARFTGATGTREQLDPLLRALGVTVMIHELPGQPDYAVTHNGTIYMIGPEAELVATLGGTPPPGAIARDVRRVEALNRRRVATTTGG